MTKDTAPPPLGGTWMDTSAALAKGGIGAIPIVGSILGEVVGLIIPNQRMDRIEAYLRHLSDRLASADAESLRAKFDDPEVVDLFEEGAVQSVRALSEERRAYITQLVANGITGDEKARIEAKRLLNLLEQIDDDQIIILTSYLHRHRNDDEWRQKHATILKPVLAHLQSSQIDLDAHTLQELTRNQLMKLGLLGGNFKTPKKGEVPEFDGNTGMMKISYRSLTPLGRLLLTRIGLAEEGEF